MNRILVMTVGTMALALSAPAAEYHVAIGGSDAADGSAARPWRTIQRAANAVAPGDTVNIHAGVYREWVKPVTAGREDAPITFQAAKGEKVVVTGADEVRGWKRRPDGLWSAKVPYDLCGGVNPFTDLIYGDWFNAKRMKHYLTQLLQDGKPLVLHDRSILKIAANPKGEDSSVAGFKLEPGHAVLLPGMTAGTILAAFERDPNQAVPELVTRPACFYSREPFCDYQTLRGITFENAGPNWAPPTCEQVGIVGTHWSRGWVIEDCEVHGSPCTGITLGKYGDEFDNNAESAAGYHRTITLAIQNGLDRVGHHTVRRCRIYDCGQAGICGSLGAVFSTVEDCEIYSCYWKKPFGGAEMGGIKIHGAVDFTIANCRIHHCGMHGGIWLDWMAQGSHLVGNTLWNNARDLFFEVDHGPVLVEGNDLLSDKSVVGCSQSIAFVGNRIRGNVRFADDKRCTPIFEPHTVKLHSLNTDECKSGAHVFVNNILGQEPDFRKSSIPSRVEDCWTVPPECWQVSESTGAVTIAPPADSTPPGFNPVTAERLGTSWVIHQEFPALTGRFTSPLRN